jgi:hypothetical protein
MRTTRYLDATTRIKISSNYGVPTYELQRRKKLWIFYRWVMTSFVYVQQINDYDTLETYLFYDEAEQIKRKMKIKKFKSVL